MFPATELQMIAPEAALGVGLIIVLMAGLWKRIPANWLFAIAIAAVAADIFCLVRIAPGSASETSVMLAGGMLKVWNLVRLMMALATLIVLVLCRRDVWKGYPSEFLALVLALLAGSQLMVIADHASLIVLALEITALASYVLAGFRFRTESSGASLKYFIYGSAATALMAFGFALIYNSGGTLNWDEMGRIVRMGHIPDTLWITGILLIMVNVLFKMAAAPVHLWAPDVYQAAPYSVLALFSSLPNTAAVILLCRLWIPADVGPTGWFPLLAALGIITVMAGNIPALIQQDIRRLMAFSSVAQAGFLILALPAIDRMQAVLFYGLTLIIGNLLVFLSLERIEPVGQTMTLQDLAGSGRTRPLAAVCMTAGLLSLVGLPPLAGFTGKLLVFANLWDSARGKGDVILMLAFILGLLNTLLAAFYYLRIPYWMFLKDPKSVGSVPATASTGFGDILLCLLAGLLILLFVQPLVF